MKNAVTTFMLCALSIKMAQAGTLGEVKPICSPDHVTVSCPFNAWDLGISALYLQPNTNSVLLNPILNAGDDEFHSVDSSWDWGFLLEGSYHFSTGNDLNLNWLHFDNDNFDELAVFFPDAAIPITRITHLKFDTNLDVVNLEFAQTSHFGKKQIFVFMVEDNISTPRLNVLTLNMNNPHRILPQPFFKNQQPILNSKAQVLELV